MMAGKCSERQYGEDRQLASGHGPRPDLPQAGPRPGRLHRPTRRPGVIHLHTRPRMSQSCGITLDSHHNRDTLAQMVETYGLQLMKKQPTESAGPVALGCGTIAIPRSRAHPAEPAQIVRSPQIHPTTDSRFRPLPRPTQSAATSPGGNWWIHRRDS